MAQSAAAARPSEPHTSNLPLIYRHCSREQLLDALRRMHLIRRFEEGDIVEAARNLVRGVG